MNFTNPHQFETISEKLLRIILENMKGTQQNRDRELRKHVNYFGKK